MDFRKVILYPYTQYLFVVLIITGALFFSFQDFLVWPAFWFDEAITLEIARNFYLFGELDISTAPGVFSGVPYIAGTNGYPLTIPLAAFFQIAGYGLVEARAVMLVWLVICLVAVYSITKKTYGIVPACVALMLITTFASFYGNGLTVTGEVPGFLFFLLALFLIAYQKDYALGGVCAGLAMAAKPGVYLFFAHAIFLFILFFEKGERIKSGVRFVMGLIPPLMLWILLVFPLSKDTFFSTVFYALNPLDIPFVRSLIPEAKLPEFVNLNKDLIIPSSGSTLFNIRENALFFLTDSTGIYFLLILIAVIAGFFVVKNQQVEQRRFIQLSLFYGVLAIAYFLRGPGWVRYLFGFQVLFLVLLFPSLISIKEKIVSNYGDVGRRSVNVLLYLCVILLIGVQFYHLLYRSNIPRSHAALNLISYLETRMKENTRHTLGLVNTPEAAAFSDPARTYHVIWLQRTMPPFGTQFLQENIRPDMIVTDGKNFLLGKEGEEILESEYRETARFGRYRVYELR